MPIPRLDVYINFSVPHPADNAPSMTPAETFALLQEVEQRLVDRGAVVTMQVNSTTAKELAGEFNAHTGSESPPATDGVRKKDPPSGHYM